MKIRVTFPDGKVICYARVEKTLIETLKEIGSEHFDHIRLVVGNHPLISQTKYEKYGDSMKPICDGWYINTQSDTQQKYMQLIAIKQQLGLDIDIEIGYDFETEKTTLKTQKNTLQLLTIPCFARTTIPCNDECPLKNIGIPCKDYRITAKSQSAYFIVSLLIGLKAIKEKNITINDQKIITISKQYQNQEKYGNLWITYPSKKSDIIKWLSIITAIMNYEIDVTDEFTKKTYHLPVKSNNIVILDKDKSSEDFKMVNDIKQNNSSDKDDSLIRGKYSFKIKDRVSHAIYGNGIITGISTDHRFLQVKFDKGLVSFITPYNLNKIPDAEDTIDKDITSNNDVTDNKNKDKQQKEKIIQEKNDDKIIPIQTNIKKRREKNILIFKHKIYKIEDNVLHYKYGKGEIVEITDDDYLIVDFILHGKKTVPPDNLILLKKNTIKEYKEQNSKDNKKLYYMEGNKIRSPKYGDGTVIGVYPFSILVNFNGVIRDLSIEETDDIDIIE